MLSTSGRRDQEPRPADVVLVDGVGWGATLARKADCLTITIAGHAFTKTAETYRGREVYRLSVDAPWRPKIRCVLGRLVQPSDHLGARES